MTELSPSVVTLFADLAQRVATAPAAGSPYRRPRDGIDSLYAKLTMGAGRVDRYLGRAGDEEAEARAEALRRGAALAKGRRETVALLRQAGVAGPDRRLGLLLDALAQAGLFEAGAVLVGTAAYGTYEPLVGARLPAPSLMTGDADLATARLDIRSDPPEDMLTILRRADPSFEPVLQLDMRKPASRFQARDGYLFDLIAPVRRLADANPVPLPALRAGAAPLQHIDWLLDRAVSHVALWGAGVPIRVPRPTRYAIHKLIVAQKRHDTAGPKRAKDLAQAADLIAALKRSDPFALEDALEDARGRGKRGWAEPIGRSLKELGNPL